MSKAAVLFVVVAMVYCANAVPAPGAGYPGFGLQNPLDFFNFNNDFLKMGGIGSPGKIIASATNNGGQGQRDVHGMTVTSHSEDGQPAVVQVMKYDNGKLIQETFKANQ